MTNFRQELASENFRKIKRYGESDVTSELKHTIKTDRSALSGKSKSCFSSCLVFKTKEKQNNGLKRKIYHREIKIQKI